MDKACGEDGFGSVDVLGVVDQNGKCMVQVEKVLHGGVAGLLLAEDSESAADGCPHTHQVLQATDGEAIDPVKREAVACGGLFQLLGSDFACLQQAQNFVSCFLDGGVEGGDPVLDIGVVPAVWDVILQGWGGCRTSERTGGLGAGGVGGRDGAAGPEAWLVLLTGVRGSPKLWSFCFARASSSVVFLRARRAVPSAGAGEWDWSCWMRRLMRGAWKARACVVLLGMSVPCWVCRVSAMPSKSRRLSRSSWRRWVTKTDSAILLVAIKPVYFPLLRVRAVYSAVPWYASCQGKMSKVGSPATPALRDHCVGCIVR